MKLADRVVEQASNVAGASPKLAKCLAELESATEATTKLVDDIGFAIKFFKKRDGAALSVAAMALFRVATGPNGNLVEIWAVFQHGLGELPGA